MLFADIPFSDIQSSLGIMTLYDIIGTEESILFRINGAHHFKPGRYHTLGFGLSADYIYKSFDAIQMPPGSPLPDMAFSGGSSGIDIGAGVFYRHEGGSYLGVSAYNLMQTAIEFDGFNYLNKRQFFLLAGTVSPFSLLTTFSVSFLPSFLVQTTDIIIPSI
jgi:hypothetical protein